MKIGKNSGRIERHFELLSGRSGSGLINSLTLLFSTDAQTYSHCVKSMLKIEAEVEATKARIEYIGRVTRLRVTREIKRTRKRS